MSRKRKKNQWQVLREQAETKEAAEKKRTRATRFGHLSADSRASIFSALPLSNRPAIASLSAASRRVVDGRAYWNAFLKQPVMMGEDPQQIFQLHPERRARDVAIDAAGKVYVENILRARLKAIFPEEFIDTQPLQQFLSILCEQATWSSIEQLIQRTLIELLQQEMYWNPDHFCQLHPGQDNEDDDIDEEEDEEEAEAEVGFVAGGALDANLMQFCKISHPKYELLNNRGLVGHRDATEYTYSQWSRALWSAARPEVLPWLLNKSINIHDVAEQGLEKLLAAIVIAQDPIVKPWMESGEISLSQILAKDDPASVVSTVQSICDNKRIGRWIANGGLNFASVFSAAADEDEDDGLERSISDAEMLAADPVIKPCFSCGLIKPSMLFDVRLMEDDEGNLSYDKLRAIAAKLTLTFPLAEAVAEPRAAIAP